MLSAFSLMPYFIVAFTMVSLLVLMALASQRAIKAGYGALMVTYLIWSRFLYAPTLNRAAVWLYLLPALWIVLLLRFGFPHTHSYDFSASLPEPHDTQEARRGASGTREALIFYFLLLLIGLITLQVML